MGSRTMVIIMLAFKEDLPCSEGPQSLTNIQQHKNLCLRTISDNCTSGTGFSARKDYKKILGTIIKHTCPLSCICYLIKIIIILSWHYISRSRIEGSPVGFFCWPFRGGASAVVYYICHCMSLYGCPGGFFCFGWPFGRCFEKENVLLAFCL